MSEERQVSIHFNHGSKLELVMPVQMKNAATALEGFKKLMETDKLVIAADGRLYVIPWTSVRLVELSALPAALPFGAINGAKIVSLSQTT
jgi:hypothetical protein